MTKNVMYRLVADEGKILTNGTINASCIDVLESAIDNWTEIDAPEEETTEESAEETTDSEDPEISLSTTTTE